MRRTTILLLSLLAASANAATYKWIDADGRVTYGDRPPSASARPMNEAAAAPNAEAPGDGRLPYALRTAAARFPVVIYTAKDCAACAAGRDHLQRRGIPFSERVLRTQADVDALLARGFAEALVPALSVGRERASGFEGGGWDALLDAAGYPKSSMLPKGWRPAAPEPLAGERGARGAPAGEARAAPEAPQAQAADGTDAADASADAPRPTARQARRAQPPPPAAASVIRF
jgi:hypothetical protein